MKKNKKKQKQTVKRIKENVTLQEYKKLMNGVRGDDTIRANTKQNLLRAFTILYYTGLRLNELQELRIKNIQELLSTGTTKLILSKTNSQRKLYAGTKFHKMLLKVFNISDDVEVEQRVIVKGSVSSGQTGINPIVFIRQVNSVMNNILGSGYTSHSFRQGLITEMGSKQINTKIISKFIGHSDVKTTMRYINPTDEDIVQAMIR